jgi:hypothetical protein
MSNVAALPGVKAPTKDPNPALIRALEDILESAKTGELQSFMATGFRADGLRMSCIFPHTNVYEVVGSLEFLKSEYMHNWTEPL